MKKARFPKRGRSDLIFVGETFYVILPLIENNPGRLLTKVLTVSSWVMAIGVIFSSLAYLHFLIFPLCVCIIKDFRTGGSLAT